MIMLFWRLHRKIKAEKTAGMKKIKRGGTVKHILTVHRGVCADQT
jgi:hypothetical protein